MEIKKLNQSIPPEIMKTISDIQIKEADDKRKRDEDEKHEKIIQELHQKSSEELASLCVDWLSYFALKEEVKNIFSRFNFRFIPLDENFGISNLKKVCIRRKVDFVEKNWDELSIPVWDLSNRNELVEKICMEVEERHLCRGGGELFRFAAVLLGANGNVWDNINKFLRENFSLK